MKRAEILAFNLLRPVNWMIDVLWLFGVDHDLRYLARTTYLIGKLTDPWNGGDPRTRMPNVYQDS